MWLQSQVGLHVVISRSSEYQSQIDTLHPSLSASQELHSHSQLELFLSAGKSYEQHNTPTFLACPWYHLLHYRKQFLHLPQPERSIEHLVTLRTLIIV